MASKNMVNPAVEPSMEDDLFAREVAEVKQWWSDPRWRYTKRPFTAEQIVSKRGNLKIEYPSNAQSKKLWKILEGRFQVRKHPCDTPHQDDIGWPMANKRLPVFRSAMPVTPMAAWSQQW